MLENLLTEYCDWLVASADTTLNNSALFLVLQLRLLQVSIEDNINHCVLVSSNYTTVLQRKEYTQLFHRIAYISDYRFCR
jgi:hypothetical protein